MRMNKKDQLRCVPEKARSRQANECGGSNQKQGTPAPPIGSIDPDHHEQARQPG